MRQPTLEEIQYLVKVPVIETDPNIEWGDQINVACVHANQPKIHNLWFKCACSHVYIHRVIDENGEWIKTFYIHGEAIVILEKSSIHEVTLVMSWLEEVCDINSH